MGAQSILRKDICSLREEQSDRIISHAKDQQFKTRFDLGKRCPEKKIRKDLQLQRILNKTNCEILEYIDLEMVNEGIFINVKYKGCGCKENDTTNRPKVFSTDFSDEFE